MLHNVERSIFQGRLAERFKVLPITAILGWLLIGGGIVLRLRQFAARLSFGNDEAALARNIVERSFGGLAQPLDFRQAAPVLFLFIQKLLSQALGNQDFILEIFPLLCACLSIYLLYRVATRHLGAAGLVAVFALAISYFAIHYAANPKQYSGDVFVTLLLIALADPCFDEQPRARDFVLLGVVGAISVWLSHPATFVLATLGVAIATDRFFHKDRARLMWAMGMGGLWAAAFAALYMLSLRQMVANAYLLKYWQSAFMPLPPWSNPHWFADAYRSLLSESTIHGDLLTVSTWSAVLLTGAVSLAIRRPRFAFLILFPAFLALIASAMQKYPFQERFLLFLLPAVYLLAAEALGTLYRWLAPWSRLWALAACALVFVVIMQPMAVSAKRNFFDPHWEWNIRPVVEYIRDHGQAGDGVFVSGGGETFQYYADSYALGVHDLVINNSHRLVHYYEYMTNLKKYAGRDRVWIVFAYFEDGGPQYERYAKYLNRVGQVQDQFETWYSRAYLVKFNP